MDSEKVSATTQRTPEAITSPHAAPDALVLTGSTSPGVRRIEAISKHITWSGRIVLFVGIFVVAYVYSLDITLRYAYQPTGTDSFSTHSLLATITVLRSVIAAAAQPACAKIDDVFGRTELLPSLTPHQPELIPSRRALYFIRLASPVSRFWSKSSFRRHFTSVAASGLLHSSQPFPHQCSGERRCGISCTGWRGMAMGHRNVGHYLPCISPSAHLRHLVGSQESQGQR